MKRSRAVRITAASVAASPPAARAVKPRARRLTTQAKSRKKSGKAKQAASVDEARPNASACNHHLIAGFPDAA